MNHQRLLQTMVCLGLVTLSLAGCAGAQVELTTSPAITYSTQESVSVTPVPTAQPVIELLVVSEQEGNKEIYRTGLDGSGLINLTNNPMDDVNPIWSPDGRHIAFNSIRDGQERIYLMRADGTQVTPVPNTGPLDWISDWSPDGQYLLVVSFRDVNMEIYAVKPDGTNPINLTRHPANDWNAAWSPDGAKIAFDSERDTEPRVSISQIYSMDADGTNVVRLTDFPNGAYYPAWSPDGQHIAFSVRSDGADRMDVYVMDADGANARQLTDQAGQNVPQVWSPDGTQLIVTRTDTAETSIVTLEDGTSQRMSIDSLKVRRQPSGELAPATTLPAPQPEPTPPSTLAIVNGTLIDGTGAEPIPDGVLVIENGRIIAVGQRAEIVIPEEAQIIDVQGGAILPGFVNAHVHITSAGNLAAWAQAGVTTVRDLGGEIGGLHRDWNNWVEQAGDGDTPPFVFAFRDAVLNHPQYARLVAAGPIVSVPGGYPSSYWPFPIDLAVTSPDDARQKVTTLLNAGADVIKISLEQGVRLSEDEVRAIVDVAHQRGTLVTAHVGTSSHLSVGVVAGIDDAAHIAPDRWSDELIAQMVADDVYMVPTLAVISNYSGKCGKPGPCLDQLLRFVEAGGKVALGDDFGNPGIEMGMPIRDMELMELAGMTPMQIIVAATRNGAHVCNLETELGTLEPGKIADVLVVNGDPLQDIHTLTEVRLVIRDGVVIRPFQNSP